MPLVEGAIDLLLDGLVDAGVDALADHEGLETRERSAPG